MLLSLAIAIWVYVRTRNHVKALERYWDDVRPRIPELDTKQEGSA